MGYQAHSCQMSVWQFFRSLKSERLNRLGYITPAQKVTELKNVA